MGTKNKNEMADLFGVSLKTIFNWNTLGWMARSGRGYDADQSVRNVTKALLAAAAGRSNDNKQVEQNVVHRGRLALAQARAVELRNAQADGLLLRADDVEARWGEILAGVRAGMLAVSARAGMRLAHLSAFDISEIDREVRLVLTEMSENNSKETKAYDEKTN
jgi:phage terminase Nu1 subunit (DNA packaging protein)